MWLAPTGISRRPLNSCGLLSFAQTAIEGRPADENLPPELENENVMGIWRMIYGQLRKDDLA